MGLKETKLILIAIKADPHIELRIISKNKLLDKNLFNRNLSFIYSLVLEYQQFQKIS